MDLSDAVIVSGDADQELLAKQILVEDSRRFDNIRLVPDVSPSRAETLLYLLDWSSSNPLKTRVADLLDENDLQLLSDASKKEQAYVLHVDPAGRRLAVVGGSQLGVLYGAATLLQLWRVTARRLRVQEIHLRDYPDFPFRAAADWLLQAEINRWAYDWGDGRSKYRERIRRKLDFCLKYKINMVFFDGFGWSADRILGYASMMREFNQYARERGIKLIFGGYGANYEPRIIRPQHNIGRAYLNRHSYPHGSVYRCLPGDVVSTTESELYLTTLGTCRANDQLMDLKVKELEEFVRSVEPGALYIHHEDQGDFDPTQEAWLQRDYRCRTRWPNDDLKAKDGGAGALAYGYSRLLEAVLGVKNPDTGYDAKKDCTVILISPVYRLREESGQDWLNVLDLWEAVLSLLPQHKNLQIGFREIFHQTETGQRWMGAYRQRMKSAGLAAEAFIFLLGGSQGYNNRYPFTASAALNGHFTGAATIYNFSGAAHQEPLQLLNSNFGWNASAPGARDPQSYVETDRLWQALNFNRDMPEEIFGDGGFLELACQQLYGTDAGRFMRDYFLFYKEQPRTNWGRLVPHFDERIHALPVLFDVLERDSAFWDPSDHSPVWVTHREQEQIRRGLGSDRREKLSQQEWHTRLAQVWELQAQVNETAASFVQKALSCPDLADEAREDVTYLQKCLGVGGRFSQLVSNHHLLLAERESDRQVGRLSTVLQLLRELEESLDQSFQFDTVGPLGGDQSSWLEALRRLRNYLTKMDSE